MKNTHQNQNENGKNRYATGMTYSKMYYLDKLKLCTIESGCGVLSFIYCCPQANCLLLVDFVKNSTTNFGTCANHSIVYKVFPMD